MKFTEEESTAEPTESTRQKIQDTTLKVADVIAEKTGIPTWGVVSIFVLIALIIVGICGFCIRRCFRKRRSKDGKKGMKGVDLKSVQLLGSAYKEKVNIIMSMGVWLSNLNVVCVTLSNYFFLNLINQSLILTYQLFLPQTNKQTQTVVAKTEWSKFLCQPDSLQHNTGVVLLGWILVQLFSPAAINFSKNVFNSFYLNCKYYENNPVCH